MASTVTVALAQLDLVVGDVSGNTERIIDAAAKARDELHADLVVFPELSVCGYPPEDLLFHAGLRHAVEESLERIRSSVTGVAVLVADSHGRSDPDEPPEWNGLDKPAGWPNGPRPPNRL